MTVRKLSIDLNDILDGPVAGITVTVTLRTSGALAPRRTADDVFVPVSQTFTSGVDGLGELEIVPAVDLWDATLLYRVTVDGYTSRDFSMPDRDITLWEILTDNTSPLPAADPPVPFTQQDILKLVPEGGRTGQVLTKASTDDYDADWEDPSGGGGGGGGLLSVATDATLQGDGTDGDPLSVSTPYTTDARDKLAGIEAGATTDQTGSEIVSAIDTQLGSAAWQSGGTSGLDRDAVNALITTALVSVRSAIGTNTSDIASLTAVVTATRQGLASLEGRYDALDPGQTAIDGTERYLAAIRRGGSVITYWDEPNSVPDTPGDSSGVGHVLTVTGENDRDYAWRAATGGSGGGGTADLSAYRTSADQDIIDDRHTQGVLLARQEARTADGKAVAAQETAGDNADEIDDLQAEAATTLAAVAANTAAIGDLPDLNLPTTPNTCLLYTSPSPRDS